MLLEGTDCCFARVLSFAEAPGHHPHLKAHGSFVTVDGITQPAPALRFGATPSAVPTAPQPPTQQQARRAWLAPERIARWEGVLGT